MAPPRFSLQLLHPRYWLTWLGMLCLALVAQLPYPIQIMLGQCLGRLSYSLVKKRREIALRNVALCFPELSLTEQKQLVKKHFETNGVALFETGMAWFMPYSRLRHRFTIYGETYWQSLREQGQGALVISAHFNTLEIANVAINRLFNLYMSYRPHDNPVYDLIQRWGRERHNRHSGIVHRRDVRGMVKVLKQGDWLWYAPDQDYGRKVSEFIPWFSIPAATVSATPRLLRMAKVPAVGVVYKRKPNYAGYDIHFLPAFENLPSGDDAEDLREVNRQIESWVRDNPAEYLWVHRRFKTRPRGEPSLYKK